MSDNRKKILLITEAMLGGIRQHVEDIALGLDKKKYDVYLAYSDNRADDKFFEDYERLAKEIHMIRCEHMFRELSLKKDVAAIRELKGIIKRIKPDIVHCHSSKAGIVGRAAACVCGVEYVYYTPHAYSFQNPYLGTVKRRIYINAERFLAKHMTTKTINVSKGEMQEALANRIDMSDKLVLIYNGIPQISLPDRSSMRKENGFAEDAILIGVTARLAKQKDPMTFLRIAKNVTQREQRAEFIYIGDGELEGEMREWIGKNSLQDKIHLMGFRNDASVLVDMLDIYLSTALYEGLPYSMIEAMRVGVPIIATDVVGNNELVTEGVNGMLFPAQDAEAGVECIMKQINNKVIDRNRVRTTFEQKYSSEVMLNEIERLFDRGRPSQN